MIAHVGIVDVQQMLVFIAHGERASRAHREHRFLAFHSFAHRVYIHFALLFGLPRQPIGNQRHTTTFLFRQQTHSITTGIHQLHQILTQLRIIIIGITPMEKGHKPMVLFLLMSMLLIPLFKGLEGIRRERAMLINAHHAVQHRFHRLQSQSKIG